MLKPKKKITKQEIERDPVLEKTVEFEQFIRHHAKNITIAVAAVVVVVLVAIFVVKSNNKKVLEASGKLGLAQLALQQGDSEDAILRLEEVIEDFGGTQSAGAAHIVLAQIYLEKGDYENAENYYSDYVNGYKDAMGKSAAYKALGVCAENKGEWSVAVDNYKKAVSSAEYKFQKQLAQLSLANANVEAKDFAAAEKIIKELETEDLDYNSNNQLEMISAKLAVMKK